MRNVLRGTAMALLLASPCAPAQEGPAFRGSISLVDKRVDSESTVTRASGTTVSEYKPDLWMVDLGLSAFYRGFYTALTIERSLGEADSSGLTNNGTTWSDGRNHRKEDTLTAGYTLPEGFSVFLGYQQIDGIRTFSEHAASGTIDVTTGDSEIRYKGPFAGFGYAHPFEKGVLSASVAKAKMKGESDQRSVNETGTTATFNQDHAEGDVDGLSYGLTWTAPLVETLSFQVGYKATRYDFTRNSLTVNGASVNAPRMNNKQNYDAFLIGIVSSF